MRAQRRVEPHEFPVDRRDHRRAEPDGSHDGLEHGQPEDARELPEVPGLELSAFVRAAASGVGGDFYDVVSMADGRIAAERLIERRLSPNELRW